jgi:hypothetical protein
MASSSKIKETASRDHLRLNFGETLKAALISRLGKLPSATYLANQFNFRANGTSAITRETARKWMNGQAIPEIERLNILIEWLELDPHKFLARGASQTAVKGDGVGDDLTIATIVELLRKMDAKTRSVVLITAWALRETNSTPLGHLNLQALKRTLLTSLTPDPDEKL